MKQPLVCIILLNYNGYKDTIECIDSLKQITYSNFKIIVVDNASNDGSVNQILKFHRDVNIIESNRNLGFSGGNNLGIKEAQKYNPDFILLLNNDTIVEKDFLNEIVIKSLEDKSIGISIGKILYYNDKDKIWYGGGEIDQSKGDSIHLGFNRHKNTEEYNHSRYVSFATGCYMLIKSEAIKSVGLMPEEYFLYYEDTHYSMEFIRKGYKILYYPKSIIYHKVSSSTGNMSDLYQYYFSRNRLMFIKNNINSNYKFLAYTSLYIDLIKNIIRRRCSIKNYLNGCKDFYKGISGNSFYK